MKQRACELEALCDLGPHTCHVIIMRFAGSRLCWANEEQVETHKDSGGHLVWWRWMYILTYTVYLDIYIYVHLETIKYILNGGGLQH